MKNRSGDLHDHHRGFPRLRSAGGRLRDECLNEHWFLNLAHAQTLIEARRGEYNEQRPKKALGGLTPAAYARQLAKKSATVSTGL